MQIEYLPKFSTNSQDIGNTVFNFQKIKANQILFK